MLRVSLCQRNKARKIMTWYARIFDTDTKEIRYESLGTTKKTEATDIMLAKQSAGEFVKVERKVITLEQAFELYLKNVEERGSSKETLADIRNTLFRLKDLLKKPVDEITKQELTQEFNAFNEHLKPSTYNTRKTYVKTAFRYIVNVLELIPTSPAEALKARKALKQERDFWTLEQIDRILDCAPSSDYRILWSLMAFAGLRIHEALKVVKEDFRGNMLYVIGKGKKPAKINVSSRLRQELDMVGWSWDFSMFNRKNHAIVRTAKVALPEGFNGKANNHRFRHSFASNLIRSGVNVKSVQKLMRHSNIQTTLNIYSHLIDDDLSNDIEKMFQGKSENNFDNSLEKNDK